MKRIRFKGEEYLFGGDSLDEAGFIAKKEDYENGVCSYAHYFPDLGVMRFRQHIGTRDDIEVLGDDTAEPNIFDALINVFTHPSWDGPEASLSEGSGAEKEILRPAVFYSSPITFQPSDASISF